jgi:hypothetical protein
VIAALDPTRSGPPPATGRRGASSAGQRYTGWAS